MDENLKDYLAENGTYAALRIPEAGKSFRAKQMAQHPSRTETRIQEMEQAALNSVALARHECSVDTCLNSLLEYDRYVTTERITQSVPKTLTDRPWENCE